MGLNFSLDSVLKLTYMYINKHAFMGFCKAMLILILHFAASLDKITVEIDGENFQLKQVGQIGIPNPQTIIINMSSYPQVQIFEKFQSILNLKLGEFFSSSVSNIHVVSCHVISCVHRLLMQS